MSRLSYMFIWKNRYLFDVFGCFTLWLDSKEGKRKEKEMSKRLTYEYVKAQVESEPGYKLLSKEYENQYTKLEIHCGNEEHPPYVTNWKIFSYQGSRCPYCAGKRVTYEQVKGRIESEPGYTLLSTKYKDNRTKLDIECNEGHQYPANWNAFQQGKRCPYCAGQIVTYDRVKQHVEGEGCNLLSKEYKNCKTKLKIQCKNKKHEPFWMSWDNFYQGHRCPLCAFESNESKGEREVAKILTELGTSFIQQHKLQNRRYSPVLDFYLPSYNLGIEYDGEQHFKPARFGGISLEKAKKGLRTIQQRDKRKDDLCKQLEIDLLRIKYTDNNIRQKIAQHLRCDLQVL